MKSTIVESIGTTVPPKSNPVGKDIEKAMSDVVVEAYSEVNIISKREDLTDNKKREMISNILNDDEIRKRKLAVRAKINLA